MSRVRLWPILIIAVALAADLVVVTAVQSSVRTALVVVFLLVCPGMAFVPLLRLQQPAVELILAVALSLALDTVASEGLALAGVWSSGLVLAILIFLTLAGATLQILRFTMPSPGTSH